MIGAWSIHAPESIRARVDQAILFDIVETAELSLVAAAKDVLIGNSAVNKQRLPPIQHVQKIVGARRWADLDLSSSLARQRWRSDMSRWQCSHGRQCRLKTTSYGNSELISHVESGRQSRISAFDLHGEIWQVATHLIQQGNVFNPDPSPSVQSGGFNAGIEGCMRLRNCVLHSRSNSLISGNDLVGLGRSTVDFGVRINGGNGDNNRGYSYRYVGGLRRFDEAPKLTGLLANRLPRKICAVGTLCTGCCLMALGYLVLVFSFSREGTWLHALIGLLFIVASLVVLHSSFKLFKTVTQKVLTPAHFPYYTKYMANVLSTDKQTAIIGALAEGSSIRSIERITGVHRDTIMRLGVRVGQGCAALMDQKMQDLSCNRLEMDEIWGFVGKKERHLRVGDDPQFGNVWTFCAIDAETKLVPAFKVVGFRDVAATNAFVADVAGRMKNRVQLSTDGFRNYAEAVEIAFGGNVDYGQIIKTYGTEKSVETQRRYSAPEITAIEKKSLAGRPDFDLISTSYIERLNATTRLHMKRLARLTHAFSKKRENFEAAVGLHFAYYNFVRRHNTLRCTPAMAAGVTSTYWTVEDLVRAT